MRILKIVLLSILVLLAATLAVVYATGNATMLTLAWAYLFGAPELPFDPADAVAAPDYSDPKNWAALPEREGLEDRVPAGVQNDVVQGSAPVDVFFIHPTGFLRGSSWTYSMDPDTASEENTQWMMANQASAYNGCCNVYAPRYRQATLFSYFKGPDIREKVLGFAYADVARAFDYFLENYSQGRPLIIASHSQGTHHGARLLKERIDGTELAARMVAAYIIGGGIAESHFDGMQDIGLCNSSTELHCAVHWDTYSESVIDEPRPDMAGNVCVNPLTWTLNGGLADKALHDGAVPVSGQFQVALTGADKATGVVFEPLGAPLPKMLQAQCRSGVLYITDQSDSAFGSAAGSFGGGNYHGLDYPVFHMDIRENSRARVSAYLARLTPAELSTTQNPAEQ